MTDRFVVWWRSLPLHWKIPASVLFLGIIFVAGFEFFAMAFKTDDAPSSNPYTAAADYRRRLEKQQRDELRRKIREIDERYNEIERLAETRRAQQKESEDEINDCDNVSCIDDALWGGKRGGKDGNDDRD